MDLWLLWSIEMRTGFDGWGPLGRPKLGRENMLNPDLNFAGSGWRQLTGFCEHGNEPSGSINYGEFLVKKYSVQVELVI